MTERKYEIVYAEPEPEAANDERQLVIAWGAKDWGFGQLTFWVGEDGERGCDNECMSRAFCKAVLDKLTATMGELQPPLVRKYPSLDALLADFTPRNPGPDWPAPEVGTT